MPHINVSRWVGVGVLVDVGGSGPDSVRRPRLPNKSPQLSEKVLAFSSSSLPASLRLTTVINIVIITNIIDYCIIVEKTVLL